jgi:hypothetical protein
MLPCDFGTAKDLKWEVLIAEMKRTETKMTKATIASRYCPAQHHEVVVTITTKFQPTDIGAMDTSTAPIKAAAVVEIA